MTTPPPPPKQSGPAQYAKRAAIFILVVAAISPALDYALVHLFPEDDAPSPLHMAFGICCALLVLAAGVACFVACIFCIDERLKRKRAKIADGQPSSASPPSCPPSRPP